VKFQYRIVEHVDKRKFRVQWRVRGSWFFSPGYWRWELNEYSKPLEFETIEEAIGGMRAAITKHNQGATENTWREVSGWSI